MGTGKLTLFRENADLALLLVLHISTASRRQGLQPLVRTLGSIFGPKKWKSVKHKACFLNVTLSLHSPPVTRGDHASNAAVDLNHEGSISALDFITSVKVRVKFDLSFMPARIQRDRLCAEMPTKIIQKRARTGAQHSDFP